MLDGQAGVGIDWLKRMHLVLLAFKSSWSTSANHVYVTNTIRFDLLVKGSQVWSEPISVLNSHFFLMGHAYLRW
jgi:hypothetical protein